MAERYLLDTCVAVRWFLEQPGYEDALRFQAAYLAGDIDLQTVDFVRFELGDVLRRKGLLLQKMAIEDYVAAARSIDDLKIKVHVTTADVLEQAAELAGRRMIAFFDAVLVAWSVELGMTILTSDAKLCSAAAGVARTQLLVGARP